MARATATTADMWHAARGGGPPAEYNQARSILAKAGSMYAAKSHVVHGKSSVPARYGAQLLACVRDEFRHDDKNLPLKQSGMSPYRRAAVARFMVARLTPASCRFGAFNGARRGVASAGLVVWLTSGGWWWSAHAGCRCGRRGGRIPGS